MTGKPGRSILRGIVLMIVAGLGWQAYRLYSVGRALDQASIHLPSPRPSAPKPPTIPANLPEFVLNDVNDKPRSITEWKGKSLILNFWATWCEPCQREIPLLKTLHAERSAEGFQVVGVAIDHREKVLAYARKNAIEYPLLVGEHDASEVADSLGVGSNVPFTVFTDTQGRIVSLRLGELKAGEAKGVLDAVSEVNQGTITLAQAQKRIAAQSGRQH